MSPEANAYIFAIQTIKPGHRVADGVHTNMAQV